MEPKITKLLQKYHLDELFTVEDLELLAYNCPANLEFEVFEPVVKQLKKSEEADELLLSLHNELWNATPLKMLNGKSPLQMMTKTNLGKHGKNVVLDDWMRIGDLLLKIQGDFIYNLYRVIDLLPAAKRDEVLDNSHLLFQRYIHTALTEKDNAVSWKDIIDEESRYHKINLPPESQLAVKVYRSPVHSNEPHRQLRSWVGLETYNEFPLISDLTAGSPFRPRFPKDIYYLFLLKELKKVDPARPQELLDQIIDISVNCWWRRNQVVNSVFTLEEWGEFWKGCLRKALAGWYSTDETFFSVFEKAGERNVCVDFIQKNVSADRGKYFSPKSEGDVLQEQFMFNLGIEFNRLFLTPLATYFPVLDLYYKEPFEMGKEIEGYFKIGYKAVDFSDWISRPPSQIKFKPLGCALWPIILKP